MPLPTDRLYVIARAHLDAMVDYYATEGVDLPERQYVSDGNSVAWDCVAGDTRVMTDRGSLPIVEVRPGMKALAVDADGQVGYHAVTRFLERGVKPTIKVRTRHRTVNATESHRFQRLVLTKPSNPYRANQWAVEWVAAGDLRVGDQLVVLGSAPENADADITPEFAWLAGVVLADGSVMTERRAVFVCVYDQLAARVADVALMLYGARSSHDMKHGQRISSKALADDLADLGLNVHCLKRRIPSAVWTWAPKLQRAFLDGYADGDGHRPADGWTAYASPNRALIEDVRALHQMLGDQCDNIGTETNRPSHILGVALKQALPLHRFRAYPQGDEYNTTLLNYRGARRAIPDRRLSLDRVSAISDGDEVPTFDITVEAAHSFFADGALVHNCEQAVVYVERTFQGLADSEAGVLINQLEVRSATLWLEVVRCSPVMDSGVPPTPEAIETNAQLVLGDAIMLAAGVRAAYKAGFLCDCHNLVIGEWQALGPAGGYVGGRQAVRHQLDCAPVAGS